MYDRITIDKNEEFMHDSASTADVNVYNYKLYNRKIIKDFCSQLMEMINGKPIIDISGYILSLGKKVWKMRGIQ